MIEGVLFDSGGVLIGPLGGRWWPIHGFEEAVLAHFPSPGTGPQDAPPAPPAFAELDAALVPAMAYMDRVHPNEDWREFYRLVIQALGIQPTDAVLDDIVSIQPASSVELFGDVLPCLTALRARGIRMAVVSDAWPNLPEMHDALGIHQFFDGYAISALVGCSKPDERMYAEGARVLGLPPERLLFIDDCDDLVHAAITLGYHGVALRRSGEPPEYPVPWITTLEELHLALDRK